MLLSDCKGIAAKLTAIFLTNEKIIKSALATLIIPVNERYKVMQPFNKKDAKQYITKLLKKHKIEVYDWSATSCGRAKIKQKKIKIPEPTNVDRFAVCLHEIFHIIGRKGSKSFEKEFYCDMYAKNILIELGYETAAWDKRTKWHILSRIAMAHNRGLNHSNINSEIREFFSEIDFTKWIGKKVFVGYKYSKTIDPNDIEFSVATCV